MESIEKDQNIEEFEEIGSTDEYEYTSTNTQFFHIAENDFKENKCSQVMQWIEDSNTPIKPEDHYEGMGVYYEFKTDEYTGKDYISLRTYLDRNQVLMTPLEHEIYCENHCLPVKKEKITLKNGQIRYKLHYPQRTGTQMGLRLSFAILCILHWYAVNKAGDPRYASIFGDDLCSKWSESTISSYQTWMMKLGFKLNKKKEFRSKKNFLFCGTYFSRKYGMYQFPEYKSILSTKTDTHLDKEFDVYLRIKEVNNLQISKATPNEIKALSRIVNDLYYQELTKVARLLPLHVPEIYGGFGLLPFGNKQSHLNVNLKVTYNNLSFKERVTFQRKINSVWAKTIQDQETRNLERTFADFITSHTSRPPKRYTGLFHKEIDEVLSDFTIGIATASQYWVGEGRSKLNYDRQTVWQCIARLMARSRELLAQHTVDPETNNPLMYSLKDIRIQSQSICPNRCRKGFFAVDRNLLFIDSKLTALTNYLLGLEGIEMITLTQELEKGDEHFLKCLEASLERTYLLNKYQFGKTVSQTVEQIDTKISELATLGDWIRDALRKKSKPI